MRSDHGAAPIPTGDELAAIAAAYLLQLPAGDTPSPATLSRWRLAGRLPVTGAQRARLAARVTSRWNAAGRLDV
jgi:hypothetical protein